MSISHVATLKSAFLTRSTALTNVALIAGGVGFLTILAQISLPVPGSPVPVTGQTLGALLIGSAYGASLGLTTFATYIAIGVVGAPVFAQANSGMSSLSGATGGYLVGMLIATNITGALAGRKWDQRIRTVLPTMLTGTFFIFTPGLIWLHHVTSQSWAWTFSKGLTPFIFGEVIKIAIASTLLPSLWKIIRVNSHNN